MVEVKTNTQVSAGGVAFRKQENRILIAIISVANNQRWQLPKGRVDDGESTEETAIREVREEAGIETESTGPINKIEYWFYANRPGKRIRIHKYVHFFLLRYLSGSPEYHDQEVDDARWVEIDQAIDLLAFNSEKEIVAQAKEMIDKLE